MFNNKDPHCQYTSQCFKYSCYDCPIYLNKQCPNIYTQNQPSTPNESNPFTIKYVDAFIKSSLSKSITNQKQFN